MPHKLVVQLRVMPAACQQFVVRAALDDFAVLQHQNLVRVPHGREPVRHDEAGAPREEFFQSVLNHAFGGRVHGARGLVENEDARPGDHRAGESEQLPLASAEIAAPLADLGLITIAEAQNDVVGAKSFRGGHHFLISRVGAAKLQVLQDRAGEEKILLRHDADLLVQ